MACLEESTTQGEIFGLRIQGLILHPDSVTCLPCGFEKLLNFPDLGFLGCEMGLSIACLSGALWEVTDVKDTMKQKGLD